MALAPHVPPQRLVAPWPGRSAVGEKVPRSRAQSTPSRGCAPSPQGSLVVRTPKSDQSSCQRLKILAQALFGTFFSVEPGRRWWANGGLESANSALRARKDLGHGLEEGGKGWAVSVPTRSCTSAVVSTPSDTGAGAAGSAAGRFFFLLAASRSAIRCETRPLPNWNVFLAL